MVNVVRNRMQLLALVVAVASLAATGCRDNEPSSPAGSYPTASLSVAVTRSPVGRQKDLLVIESAKVLLKNVRFHSAPSRDTADVLTGPTAVNLNLAGDVTTIWAGPLPAGSYDGVRFRLHKPEDFEPIPDPEFRDGPSGNLRYSVIVKGSFNGRSFVYRSRQNADRNINLNAPLVVVDDRLVNVTLAIDPYAWFADGGDFRDPSDSRNEPLIDDAIRSSFSRCLRDDDRDGLPD